MSADPAVEHLGRTWHEVEAAREEYCRAAEDAVVRWAWGPSFANWERFEPLFAQRIMQERPRTRELPEPEDRTTRELFGFDGAGRVVVARTFQNWPVEGVREEQLLVEGVLLWFGRPGLRQLHVPEFDEGRIVSVTRHRHDPRDGFAWSSERYVYDGGRLSTVRIDSSEPDDDPYSHHVEWDPDGEVGRVVTEYGDGERRARYIRPPKGGIGPIRKRVATELPDRIAAWAARSAPDEPVWALALLYDAEGNPVLPPSLGLAVEADRDDDPDVMFNPAEWKLMDAEPDVFEDLAEDIQILNQHWESNGNFTTGRRILLDVARELRDRDWDGLLQRSDDFEVFAVDLELEDLERNRRALTRRGA